MARDKQPFQSHRDATRVAVKLCSLLTKMTWKIAPAGDVRMKKPTVHRIKLVAIPKFRKNLLGEYDYHAESLMDLQLMDMGIRYKLDKPTKHFYYEDYPIEIHTSPRRDSWGLLYLRLTGPRAFSTWATINKPWGALPLNYKVDKKDVLYFEKEAISTPTEKSFFNYIGMKYISLDHRQSRFDYCQYLPKVVIEDLV